MESAGMASIKKKGNRLMKHLICAFTGILLLSGGFCFADYEIHKDIAYYAPSEIKSGIQKERGTLDLLLPEQRNGFATIIFFHGGGLYDGEKEDVQSYLKKEFGSRKDLAIVTPNYRRYKDVKVVNGTRKLFPAFYQDAAAAVAWVKKNIAKYGGDPDKIYISGHSGGAYLALMLILKKGYLRERKIDPDRDLKACFPISATPRTNSCISQERYGGNGTEFRADQDSPIFMSTWAKGTLPIILCVEGRSTANHLVGYREGNMLVYALLKQCAKYPAVKLHVFEEKTHTTVIAPALQTIRREMMKLER